MNKENGVQFRNTAHLFHTPARKYIIAREPSHLLVIKKGQGVLPLHKSHTFTLKNIKEKDTWTQKRISCERIHQRKWFSSSVGHNACKKHVENIRSEALRFVDEMFQNSRILLIYLLFFNRIFFLLCVPDKRTAIKPEIRIAELTGRSSTGGSGYFR